MSVGSITEEIDACDFGDSRLKTRLQIISQRLLEKPNTSIPSACSSRAEMEAAYRFFGNPNVTPDEILNSHASASLARVKKSNIALLVQDTTEIDLTRPDSVVSGAGPLSSDTQLGAFYHPMMAFEPSGLPIGTVWSKRWVRDSIHKELTPQEKLKARKRRPIADKESFRWIEGVQAASVVIARPNQNDSKVSELKINLVLVEETCAPEGEIPIRWYLLTTLPIDTVEAVSTVIEYYCNRWQIEIYFRTLKSGCKIEERYFERFTRLENCMAIYAIIAWRILYLCRLGEECPDVSCEVAFSPSEWKPIVKVVKRIEPSEPPRLSEMIKMVASLGGYVIRSNTKPGTQTLWLGLQRVHDFATAWDAFGPDSQIARGNSP